MNDQTGDKPPEATPSGSSWRSRFHAALDPDLGRSGIARAIDLALIVLIATNVAAVILETVESVGVPHARLFHVFELVSVAVFSVEYLLRLWIVPERALAEGAAAPGRNALRARLRYAVTPMALIDLLAIAPFYLAMFFSIDLRFIRIFRLLRILKLTRHSAALSLVGSVLHAERRALFAAAVVMLVLLVIASSLMYFAERHAQPDAFASIPHAMWWGIVTLTTVGYGDVTPVTTTGRILGSVVAILGVGMFAMPAGILASGFAQAIKSRDFVVEWRMVAGVPIFSRLEAVFIADIVSLLQPQVAVPGETIIREGDTADCMYFIASGECEVLAVPRHAILAPGDFFGEIALLEHGRRHATVRARSTCQLLVLQGKDFDDLLERSEDLRRSFTRVAEERMRATQEPFMPD